MLTVKLFLDKKIFLVDGRDVTVTPYNASAFEIVVHQNGAEDRLFYVGKARLAPKDCAGLTPATVWYDHAYVENAYGRTTQTIRPMAEPPTPDTG